MPVAVPSPTGGARPGGSPDDLAAVWAVITGMYLAFTAGDRPRIDSFLDPDATVFDSETPGLIRGKTELDEVRDRRPPAETGPRETGLDAYGETVDVFGHLALARYWLRVDYASRPARTVRNTAVLRRAGDSWQIVHLHEDLQQDLVQTPAGR